MNNEHIIAEILHTSRRQIVQYAFWRWESGVIIALSLLMTGLSLLDIFLTPQMWWMWLLFGLIGEAVLIWTGMNDKKLMAKMASKLFYEQLGPAQLSTPQLKQAMSAALDFHRGIFGAVASGRETNVGEIALDMDNWVVHVFRVINHLDKVVSNPRVLDPLPVAAITARLKKVDSVEAYAQMLSDISRNSTTMRPEDHQRLQKVHGFVTQAKAQVDISLGRVNQIQNQFAQGIARGHEKSFVEHVRSTLSEQFVLLERSSAPLEVLLRAPSMAGAAA